MSRAEASFFQVVYNVIGPEYRLFAKVRLADIIQCERGFSRSAWQSQFNRISAKHVDLLMCRADTSEIVGVIELDDSSHNSHKAKTRDQFVDEALASACIPILRFKASNYYAPETLKRDLAQTFNLVPAQNEPRSEPKSLPISQQHPGNPDSRYRPKT